MARLAILGSWHGGANCTQYAAAFERLGHQVIRIGPRFTRDDVERWKEALLAMDWPPTEQEASVYVAKVLLGGLEPQIVTAKGAWVHHWNLPAVDAVLKFDAYGETPLFDGQRGVPCVVIYGDTHTGRLAEQVEEAGRYDHVFVQFRRADLAAFDYLSKHWLPAAADPSIWFHAPEMEKRYDVLFVGATDPRIHRARVELLQFLKRELGEDRVVVKHAFGTDAAVLMNQAKIVLNHSLAGDLNMRVPEALCTGSALVTDEVDGLDDFGGDFWSDWSANGARSLEALVGTIRSLLHAPALPCGAGVRARKEILDRHTYEHRARQILAVLGLEQSNARGASEPAVSRLDAAGAGDRRSDRGRASDREKISIIIPVFNHWADCTLPLLRQLQLDLSLDDTQVLVVNDGSSDETPRDGDVAGARFLWQPNKGFASACNFGAAQAKGTYLVFLNNDTEPQEGWLAPLIASLKEGAAIAGPLLLFPDGRVQSVGLEQRADGSWWNKTDAPSGPREEKAVTGACLAIRRDVFFRLGGFDEGFVGAGGCEDVDLCLRARAAGLKIVLCPKSRIVHREGSTRAALPETGEQIRQNQQRLRERWESEEQSDVSGWVVDRDRAGRVPGDAVAGVAACGGTKRSLKLGLIGPHDAAVGGSLAGINTALLRTLPAQGIAFVPTTAEADVVLLHYWPGLQAHVIPEDARRVVVIQPWEGLVPVPESWVATWKHPAFRALLTPSEYSKRFFVAAGVPAERVRVVPNGVDLSLFTPEGARLPIRKTEQPVFRVLFVGGLIARKGVDVLYDAWRQAFKADEPVRLVLKAQGSQSFYRNGHVPPPADLANVQPLDMDSFTPEQMAKLYRSCDLLVLPSRGEAFGLPVLEAMACGKAVLVPAGGPWEEYVPDAACLRLPSLEAPLLAKMLRWASQNQDRLAEMGQAGVRAAQGFSWEAVAERYAAVLREVCT